MRNLLLAVAFALGLGFAAAGAQAATVGNNVTALQSSAKAGNSLVEKTHYRRRYWRHRHWRPYRYYRPYRYHRPYYGRNHYRPHYWRHHRRWR